MNTSSIKVILSLLVLAGTGCSSTAPRSYSQFLLDTTITITAYDRLPSRTVAQVFDYVADVERRMSTTEADWESTELLQVNRAAGQIPVQVSEDTFQLMQKALFYSELREGAFDVTIWPLSRIWDIDTLEEQETIPTAADIQSARALVDHTQLVLDTQRRTLYLSTSGMGVDVGAIAKGWAADRAAAMLVAQGFSSVLLDFGGNIVLIGHKPDNQHWKVGVQNPHKIQGRYLGIIESGPAAIVTSGNYERFYEYQGVRYHHILDPSTGWPVENTLSSVTIISARATDADVLSTMVYVLGAQAGLQLIESLPNTETIMVTAQREIIMSSGAKEQFTLTDNTYQIFAP